MARRHEDRKPGQRFARGAKKGPSKKGPSKKGTAKKAPGKKAPTKRAPTGKPAPRTSTTRAGGSRRRAAGIVVTPAKSIGAEAVQDGKVRLNHFLAKAGICSRRNADELIAGGRVEVNGERVTELGVRVDPDVDDVRFDGARLEPEKAVYVLLNKPKGIVCTNARHEVKKRVVDLLPQIRGRIFTVGRLDLESEGLILVTNDGAFAQEMTHPRYGVSKLYTVLVRGRLEDKDLDKARGGVWLAEGPTSGMQISIGKLGKDRTFLKVTLREGKNREIRRVFAKLGHPVISLKRVRIGNLNLHGLGDGDWRFLQLDEVAALRDLARSEAAEAADAPPPARRAPPRPSGPKHQPKKPDSRKLSRPQTGGRKPSRPGGAGRKPAAGRARTTRKR